MGARLLIVSLLLALGASGCAMEQELLEKEREKLVKERDGLQQRLNQYPPGLPWNADPVTQKTYEDYHDKDAKIKELNRQLRKW